MEITHIVVSIIGLIVAYLTTRVIPLIKSKVDAESFELMKKWVAIAVESAEQMLAGSGRGSEKKQLVVAFLNDHGFTLDTAELDAVIESAVYELNNK